MPLNDDDDDVDKEEEDVHSTPLDNVFINVSLLSSLLLKLLRGGQTRASPAETFFLLLFSLCLTQFVFFVD